MMAKTDIKVTAIDYHRNGICGEGHRNGICGEGFYVALFDWNDGLHTRPMLGVVFPERDGQPSMRTAVFDRNLLAAGNIAFAGGNSWRGDQFAGPLHRAIQKYEKEAR